MPTNTEKTLNYLREQHYKCDIVERWIRNPKHPAGGFRKDWMGFADIVALGENSIIAVQSCGQAFSEHDKKITTDETVAPNALLWLKCGGRLLLIGWRKKLKKRGGKFKVWTPRIREYFIDKDECFKHKDFN